MQDVPAPERGDRSRIDRRSTGTRCARRCARVTAETIVVGVPGDMLFPWALQVELHRELQAAGRAVVAVEARLRCSATTRSSPIRIGSPICCAAPARSAATLGPHRGPRFEGVGERAGPRDSHRPGRLRHRRARAARDDRPRSAAPVAERYGVRFRVSRIAVRDLAKERGPLADGIPIDRRAARAGQRSRSRRRRRGRRRHGGRAGRCAPRSPPASRWSPRTRRCSPSKLAELGVLAQRTATPLYCEARRRGRAPDPPPPESSRRRGGQPRRHRQRHLQLRHHADGAGRAAARRRRSPKRRRSGSPKPIPRADLDGARRRRQAVDPRLSRVRRLGAARRLPGARHPRPRPADCDLAEAMGCRIRLIARAARVERRARHGGRAAAAAGVAPARLGRRGIQRGLPAVRCRLATSACSAKAPARCRRRPRCSAT